MIRSRVVRSSEVEPVEMLPGVRRRTLACGEKVMIVRVTLDQGAEVPQHSHPHEQAGYVVAGELTFTIGDEVYRLGPGDSYDAPSGVEHSATAHSDAVILDVFSPPREEYR